MTVPAIEFQAATDEVVTVFIRLRRTLDPEYLGTRTLLALRDQFRKQAQESFAKEGPADAGDWAPLSELRVTVRGDSNPILRDTGDLADSVSRFKGKMRAGEASLSYWYPDFPEMSGKYWGLTAGQRINPLGMTPLAATPRPVLAGSARSGRDTLQVLAEYFVAEGLLVTFGGETGE